MIKNYSVTGDGSLPPVIQNKDNGNLYNVMMIRITDNDIEDVTKGKEYQVILIHAENEQFLIRNDKGYATWIDFDECVIV